MYNIKQLFEDVQNQKAFNICFGDFLDEFYLSSSESQPAMINEEPLRYKDIDQPIYVYAAAAVHKLANDHNLPVPEWVFDEYYFLEEPYFSINARGKLRLLLLYQSPPEFKFRNFFEMENTLSRV
jgi:hypothetical protein